MNLLNTLADKMFPPIKPDRVVSFNPKDASDEPDAPGTVAAFDAKYGDRLDQVRVLVVDVVDKVNYYSGPRILTPDAIAALSRANEARRQARQQRGR